MGEKDLELVRLSTRGKLRHAADCQFEEFFGWVGADDEFGKFGPFAPVVDAEDGVRFEGAEGETPGDGVGLVEEFDFAFEEAAVVKGAHAIGFGLVIEGDDAECLQGELVVGFGAADAFDDKEQAVEFVLDFLGLVKIE